MIVLDCEQGSDEWLRARLGLPTASVFDRIVTSTGKPSSQSHALMHKLLYEWLTGKPADNEINDWMRRGTELEPDARSFYELQTDADVARVGFVLRDDSMAGCSPDGMVGDAGLVELKCPSGGVQVEYLLGGFPAKYRPQVQGQLWICEREWCDFLSYHPDLDPVLVRVHRDDKYIRALASAVDDFVEEMLDKREQLRQRKAA